MPSRAVPGSAAPEVRSRAAGAARPLDDVDRGLLNLLQGSFPATG